DHPAITFLPDMIKKSSPSVRVVVHIESLGGLRRERSNFARAASRFAASILAGRSGLSYEYGTLLRDSDAVITLSERDKGELIKYHSQVATKVLTISPPPIMPVVPKIADRQREHERSRLGLSRADDLLLGFYGYIYPGKGIETLFDAVHRLISRGLNVKVMVVGDVPETYVLQREGRPAYLNDLKMLARDLQIFERVIWSDYEPYGSDVPSKKLRLCDMCIFPFGAGIHEHNSSVWFAAAHGLPLVATRSATTENIFVDGENILFAKPEDSADLATKVSELWNCEDLRRKIGANIEILANQKYSWSMCVDNVLGVFRIDR
ncbi:MAG: glycosyltransferase family 4 protein, partial [Candidatus Obscuribacterales bacterium]